MTAPFVGLPTTGTGCAYSPDVDQAACGAPPTVHVIANSAWGVVGLESCRPHAVFAVRAGKPLEEHPYGEACKAGTCTDASRYQHG